MADLIKKEHSEEGPTTAEAVDGLIGAIEQGNDIAFNRRAGDRHFVLFGGNDNQNWPIGLAQREGAWRGASD
jgi:hypothetical protein